MKISHANNGSNNKVMKNIVQIYLNRINETTWSIKLSNNQANSGSCLWHVVGSMVEQTFGEWGVKSIGSYYTTKSYVVSPPCVAL